jgi:predicted 2-oxoglutarate/Fe(II)-dependent dioxygenase YbiX
MTDPEPFAGPEVLVYENALTPSACARVASLSTTCMRLATVRAKRLSLGDDPVLAAAEGLVTSAGKLHFNVGATAGIPVTITMTLLEYPQGAAMPRHYDNQIEGRSASRFAAVMGQPSVGRQPYACCFYLTDPGQYGGGELLIDDHPPMRPGLGDAVFIRGDVQHSVNGITRGTRHVLKGSVFINPPTPLGQESAR